MKAILYARFSPRPRANECDSIQSQLADLRKWCAHQGHEIVGEYDDFALSGADHDRPGLWNAVGNLKRGYLLVVRNLDRLSRDHRLSVQIEIALCKAGAKLAAVENGGILEDSPEQELMRLVLGGLAQYHRKIGNLRTSAKMLAHQASGRCMGNVPYGQQRDPNDPARLIENPSEQRAIAVIRSAVNMGLNPSQIATMLNAERIACRGGSWQRKTVGRIVRRLKA